MTFDWLTAFFVVAGVASLLGLMVAVRTHEARRFLVAEWTAGVAVASVFSHRADDQMWLMYQARGGDPIRIRGAFLFFVRIANLGGTSVRRGDIAPADPLRIVVRGGRVLDISLVQTTNPVCRVEVTPPELGADGTTSRVAFDFLDRDHGALFRVLAESARAKVSVEGTIIDQGSVVVASTIGRPRLRTRAGFALSAALYLAFAAAALRIYEGIAGSLSTAWLLLLPVGVALVPSLLIVLVAVTIWPKSVHWPRALGLPPVFDFALSGADFAWRTQIEYQDDGPGIVAFAGRASSGKSTISRSIASELGWARVSFGDYVRRVVRDRGLDDTSREVLQLVGQELVETNCEGFVRAVLAQADWEPGDPLVVDGVRHVAVAESLRHIAAPSDVLLVLVTASDGERAHRLFGDKTKLAELRQLDEDPTERDLGTALPHIADVAVDGGQNIEASKEKVMARLRTRRHDAPGRPIKPI